MIDYINMKLTVNCDAEIERAVELLSHLCAEGYVGATRPYNPSWCTVDVHLVDYDAEGPHECGLAEITVLREDAPSLRGLVAYMLESHNGYDLLDLSDLAEAYESLERADEEARMQDEFRQLSYENDYVPSLYA